MASLENASVFVILLSIVALTPAPTRAHSSAYSLSLQSSLQRLLALTPDLTPAPTRSHSRAHSSAYSLSLPQVLMHEYLHENDKGQYVYSGLANKRLCLIVQEFACNLEGAKACKSMWKTVWSPTGDLRKLNQSLKVGMPKAGKG